MLRLNPGSTLVIATHNQGKRQEFATLLAPAGIICTDAAALNLAEPEETGVNFAANAQIKAQSAAGATGLAALADDSGLSVAALGGAPGLRSARFAQECGGYAEAMARVIAASRGDNRAWFTCALCLALPTGETATYLGFCHGIIAEQPRGTSGFGYDPIFVPLGQTASFAELSADQKHQISHRARAIRQFLAVLPELNQPAAPY
jgi:XTP/dITP diphosphohydrolase